MSMSLEDSTTYQWILKRGEAKGKREAFRNMLLTYGTARFGSPSEASANIIREVQDPARLESLVMGILDAANWDELLAC